MTNFQGYRNPFNNYYNYYNLNKKNIHKSVKNVNDIKDIKDIKVDKEKINRHQNSNFGGGNNHKKNILNHIKFVNPFFSQGTDSNEPILEIFGLSLFLDDLIILGILFFLYSEGVKDEMLFFSLILLLMS